MNIASKKGFYRIWLVILALLLAACQPATAQPGEGETQAPTQPAATATTALTATAPAPTETQVATDTAQPTATEPAATETATAEPTEAPTEAPTEPASPEIVMVSMVGQSFEPAELSVPVGTTVRWTNESSLPHTVTADEGAFDSGTVDPGGDFEFTFDQAGTYPYHCEFHGAAGGVGMSGTITVTDG